MSVAISWAIKSNWPNVRTWSVFQYSVTYGNIYYHELRYHICQNIRGGKLLRFLRILAKRESFTIESFPSSQLENFIIIP